MLFLSVPDLLAAAFAFRDAIEGDQVMLQVVPQLGVVHHLLPQLLVLQLHGLDAHGLIAHAPGQDLQCASLHHQVRCMALVQIACSDCLLGGMSLPYHCTP